MAVSVCGIVLLACGTADAAGLSSSVNAFAFDLFGKLRSGDDNLFISPLSAAAALAMAHAGARGQSAQEMAKVLHLPEQTSAVHDGFEALFDELNAARGSDCRLLVANAAWPHAAAHLLPEYVALVRSRYDAIVQTLDFTSAAREAENVINRWVADRTENTIKQLIPQGTIDLQTRLVLTNAVYFKGAWAERFALELTVDAPFTLSNGEKVTVRMMHRTGSFGHARVDRVQLVELPYATETLSMVVLLPDDPNGLDQLEKSITAEAFAQWAALLKPTQIAVYIPRFKSSSDFRLDDALKALGMRDAFSQAKADFEGMTGKKDLFIGGVFHSSFVDVNEAGAEAAGATGVVMNLKSGAHSVFKADHPFLYVIRHIPSNCILFLGRMAKPQI